MKAEQIRWIMEVLRRGLYVELGLAAVGFITAMAAAVIKSLPSRGLGFLFGLLLGALGISFCFLSGMIYDRLNSQLRAAETLERKEKAKEEKYARKKTTN